MFVALLFVLVRDKDNEESPPIIELNDMDQLPQRAGEKIPFFAKVGLIFTLLKRLPRFISNRPSVIDQRVTSVSRYVLAQVVLELKTS